MDFIAAKEVEKFRVIADGYVHEMFPDDKAKQLQAENLVEAIISIHSSALDQVYVDMQKWANLCKFCAFQNAEPKGGTFEQKTDAYLKNRSKWTVFAWGTIVMLLMVIGGILNNQFSTMARDVRYIKEEIVPMVKYNNTRMDQMERIHLTKPEIH